MQVLIAHGVGVRLLHETAEHVGPHLVPEHLAPTPSAARALPEAGYTRPLPELRVGALDLGPSLRPQDISDGQSPTNGVDGLHGYLRHQDRSTINDITPVIQEIRPRTRRCENMREGDSNPTGDPTRILSLARLPVPPLSRGRGTRLRVLHVATDWGRRNTTLSDRAADVACRGRWYVRTIARPLETSGGMTMARISDLLGKDADSLLNHRCTTIDRSLLQPPRTRFRRSYSGPDRPSHPRPAQPASRSSATAAWRERGMCPSSPSIRASSTQRRRLVRAQPGLFRSGKHHDAWLSRAAATRSPSTLGVLGVGGAPLRPQDPVPDEAQPQ